MKTEYEKGDKAIIEIDGIAESLNGTPYVKIDHSWVSPNCLLGKLEDFQPAQEKIKMTVEEKKEFDDLKDSCTYISEFWVALRLSKETTHLYSKLNEYLKLGTESDIYLKEKKLTLSFFKPELIEVVHEDVKIVKVAGLYLWKYASGHKLVDHFDKRNENYYFTKAEVKEINKLPKFKYVDLVTAWEDGK